MVGVNRKAAKPKEIGQPGFGRRCGAGAQQIRVGRMRDENFPLSPNRATVPSRESNTRTQRRSKPLSTKGLWQIVSYSNAPLNRQDSADENLCWSTPDAVRTILALYEWTENGKVSRDLLDASVLDPELGGKSAGPNVDPGNCLLCVLRNQLSKSSIGSVHGARRSWMINICEEHGEFIQRRDRRGQPLVTVQGDMERLERDGAEPRNLRPWLRVGWRGVGYWCLADSDLLELGINFRHI